MTKKEETRQETEIDLLEIGSMLLSKIKYIILFLVIGAVVFGAYTVLFIAPTYKSTSKLYVVSASSDSVVNLADLNIGTSLANDYQELMLSYPVLDQVSEELNLDWTAKTLAQHISVVNVTNTRILEITATTNDPELSMNIANTLAEVSVKYLPDTMSTNEPNIAQYARIATAKSGPSTSKNTLLGAVLGLVLSCIVFIIRFLLDDSIRTAEDMEKIFGEMPLTSIPYTDALDDHVDSKKKRGKGVK